MINNFLTMPAPKFLKISLVMMTMYVSINCMVGMEVSLETNDKITKCFDIHYGFEHLNPLEYLRPVLNHSGTCEPGKIQWQVPTPDNRIVVADCAVVGQQMIKDRDTAPWEREMFDGMAQGAYLFQFRFPGEVTFSEPLQKMHALERG